MKNLLIISPYFPPSNAADMQRIRMSLPYFNEFGWAAEIVCVDDCYSDMVKDEFLLKSIPEHIVIHKVKAFSKKVTSKLGLGSIALRSLLFYRSKVDKLLRTKKYDLVFFSTTQFPVCILGPYWKLRFGIPYVIDIQDLWHSDYYKNKPRNERPRKYWFSYRLNKFLEPIAMKRVDGLISVSADYIEIMNTRYPALKTIPSETITFGTSDLDWEIAANTRGDSISSTMFNPDHVNMLYIGRGGYDMYPALTLLFRAVNHGLANYEDLFSRLRLYFIGTSYAAPGNGSKTIQPLAEKFDLGHVVTEQTDRVAFYTGLKLLSSANLLLIPGSDDPQYTASKLYPVIQSRKQVVAILHRNSSGVHILQKCLPDNPVFTFPGDEEATVTSLGDFLKLTIELASIAPALDEVEFNRYSAKEMTRRQVNLFNLVIQTDYR